MSKESQESENKNKNRKFIVSCNCGDTPTYCRSAYKLLFKTEDVPEQYTEKTLYRLLPQFDSKTNIYRYLSSLRDGHSKYAYYFEVTPEGDIAEQWNLFDGKKVG